MTEIRNEVWNILICNFEIVSNFGFRASDLAVFNEQKLTKKRSFYKVILRAISSVG